MQSAITKVSSRVKYKCCTNQKTFTPSRKSGRVDIVELKKLIETDAKNEALTENKAALENQVTQLAVQKKVLSKRVKSLSEAQLEAELLIALQKNQVDSFKAELLL